MMSQNLSNFIPFSFTVALTTSTFALGVAVEPAQAETPNPDQIFIFGDSLSDGGNFFNISGGFPPEPFYIDGRFSNGPTWAEYLAEDLDLTPTLFTAVPPSLIPAGGLN
ncbi:MAG: SGNH/GDSL hydrolase family protein, partial [Crocosphaera sp.]